MVYALVILLNVVAMDIKQAVMDNVIVIQLVHVIQVNVLVMDMMQAVHQNVTLIAAVDVMDQFVHAMAII